METFNFDGDFKLELNLLRVDLDIPTKKEAIKHLKGRLSYFNDVEFMFPDNFVKLDLIYKTKYSVKIHLKENLKSPKDIILLQVLLGSDWMKEVNTILNHYKFQMEYSNRMFNCKRYTNGKIKIAKKIDVTEEILNYVSDKKRRKFFN